MIDRRGTRNNISLLLVVHPLLAAHDADNDSSGALPGRHFGRTASTSRGAKVRPENKRAILTSASLFTVKGVSRRVDAAVDDPLETRRDDIGSFV